MFIIKNSVDNADTEDSNAEKGGMPSRKIAD